MMVCEPDLPTLPCRSAEYERLEQTAGQNEPETKIANGGFAGNFGHNQAVRSQGFFEESGVTESDNRSSSENRPNKAGQTG